jgi:hypothetical protein
LGTNRNHGPISAANGDRSRDIAMGTVNTGQVTSSPTTRPAVGHSTPMRLRPLSRSPMRDERSSVRIWLAATRTPEAQDATLAAVIADQQFGGAGAADDPWGLNGPISGRGFDRGAGEKRP